MTVIQPFLDSLAPKRLDTFNAMHYILLEEDPAEKKFFISK